MRREPLRLAALAVLVAACGGGQTQGSAFDRKWQADDGTAIAAVQEKLATVSIPIGADVAIGVEANTI
jgi:outer membrane protein assembly factor BamB